MPRRDSFDRTDVYDSRWGGYRNVAPPTFLAPTSDNYYSVQHRRSRSTGGQPVPQINIINRNRNEFDDSPPRSRSRGRQSDAHLVDAVDNVAYEIRRGRSREPGYYRDPSPNPGYANMQLELARERERSRMELERERERLEQELSHERYEARERLAREEELLRTKAEIIRLKHKQEDEEKEQAMRDARKNLALEQEANERKARDARQQLQLQIEADERKAQDARDKLQLQIEADANKKKAERERIRLELERAEKEEDDRRKRIVNEQILKEEQKKKDDAAREAAILDAHHRKIEKEKREKEDLIKQIKYEEEQKKKKLEAEKEEWRLKLEQEEREKKDKEKKKQEEIDEEVRKKLSVFGFQKNQVDVIIDPTKAEKLRPGQSPGTAVSVYSKPTYIRIHRNHIDVETLRYYGLPWEYDGTDTNYVVILQEISHRETELLFEHTRKLRKGPSTLLIEDRGRQSDHKYAFVRRRPSASPSGRRKSSPKRVSVNFGLFG